jgi:CRISPR system Cascade subunit CasA
MNLTTDPWVPVLRTDGRSELLSLRDLFAQAHAVRDLVAKPHERIALMRLLLCITQAALDGPADEDAWAECRDEIQPRVDAYLQKWHAAFELFGDGPRFLQLAGLAPGKADAEGNPATKLDLALATGNNATLFDNDAAAVRQVRAARAALNLLTFQCFSPGGRIGVARWHGAETPGKGSSNHAPCLPSSMLYTLVLGPSLLDTVVRNLLTKDLVAAAVTRGWGRPVWEHPVATAADPEAITNATLTYLGRLVPLSRAVRLDESGETIVLANGLDYPIFPAFREPTATVVVRKDEFALLPALVGRSPWRQLHAIVVKRRADAGENSGPLALDHPLAGEQISLWVGALVTDQAKIEDTVEAAYPVPTSMFGEFGRAAYESGVNHAETGETSLRKAVGFYASCLKIDPPAYDAARRHFWTRVEQSLDHLFAVARELTPPDQLAASPWGRAVRAAAIEAYERVCPRRTPRQIQAFALGQRHLFAAPRTGPASAPKPKSRKQRSS